MAHEHVQERSDSPPGAVVPGGDDAESLRRANALLGGLVEGSRDLMAVQDTEFHFIAFNRAYQAEFKAVYGAELKTGDSMLTLLDHLPEESRSVRELWARTLRGEEFTETLEFGDPALGRRSYEIQSFPIRDPAGLLIGGAHIARDVTVRDRAEAALCASEENYRRIIASSTDCIKVLDLEGRMLSINPCGRRLMEIEDPAQFIGLFWLDTWQGEGRQLAAQAMERARSGGIGHFCTLGLTMKGNPKWWDETVSPILDAAGRPERLMVMANDITQRKQAEDEIRRSEDEFRTFFESSSGGKAQADAATGRFLRVNGQLCEMTGYSCEELLCMRIGDVIHPDDRERNWNLYCQVRDSEAREYSIEIRYLRKDGAILWVQANVGFLRDETGKACRSLAVIQDITPLKRIEQELRASEERFVAFLHHLPIAAWMKDLQGRYVYVNPEAERIFSKTLADLQGRTDEEIFPPEPARQFSQNDHRVLTEGCLINTTEVLRQDDGLEHLSIINKFLITGADGSPAFICGAAFDITERKKAEERLTLLSEAAAHLLQAENPDLMIRELFERVARHLDLQGYMNFMVNEAGDALRLDSYAGVPEETARRFERLEFGQEVCGRVAQSRQPIYAFEIQQSDEEMVQLIKQLGIHAYACNPLMPGGRLLGTLAFATSSRDRFSEDELGFMRTICHYVALAKERLRLEGELRSHIKGLAEADRRKDEFLAMMAHELRNPLAPIRNAAQVLRLAAPKAGVLERQRDIIDRQVTHMSRLLDDMLDVSRITRGNTNLHKSVVRVSDVFVRAVESANPLIESRRHTLRVSPPAEGLQVYGDIDRLIQIVSNLLSNAAKYTEEGGTIWLEAQRGGEEVVIQVRDTGVGIAPEMLPKVFDVFTQVTRTLDRSQGGLGLGLTLVRSLTQMHGGSVDAHSAGLGQGSKFIVRLPALPAEQTSGPQQEGTPVQAPVHPHRILVVDDVADTADSLAELLGLFGHEVRTAYDGPSGITLAQEFHPDVILLDIGLPGEDGYEVARQIRRDENLKGVVLVALTGYGQEEDRRLAEQAGFDHLFTKPVELGALQSLLA